MYVERLIIEDFQCFAGEHVVELTSGVVVVVGPNDSGKTALLESISWCLYGADGTRRGKTEDDLVNDHAKRARVRVEFSDGSWVERTRVRRGRRSVQVCDAQTGETKHDKAAKAAIERLVGCDRERFGQCVYVAQRSVDLLARSRPAERRRLLLGLVDDGSWERLVASVEQEAVRRDGRAVVVAARLDEAQLSIGEHRPVPDIEADLDAASCAAEQLEAYRQAETRAARRRQLEEELTVTRSEMERISTPTEVSDDVDALREEVYAARKDWDDARKLVSSGFDGCCPVTRDACPARTHVDIRVQKSKQRLAHAEHEHALAVEELRVVEDEMRRVDMSRRERDKMLGRWNRVVEELRGLGDGGSCPDFDASTLEERAGERSALERELAEAHASARTRLRVADLKQACVVAKRSQRVAQLLLRGVRSVPGPVAAARDELEFCVGQLLGDAATQVRIEWESESSSGAGRCQCGHRFSGAMRACPSCGMGRSRGRSDKVEIYVRTRVGREEPVEACGGLGDIVCLALGLSASHVGQATRLSARLLDEVGVHLKGERVEQLADLLDRVSLVGVEQVILSTNRASVLGRWGAVIEVEPTGTGSRVVVRR